MIKSFESYSKGLKPGSKFMDNDKTSIEGGDGGEQHIKWCKKYPELNHFTFESHYLKSTMETVWTYEYKYTKHDVNLEVMLEIRKGKAWSVDFDFEESSRATEQVHKVINKAGMNQRTANAQLDSAFEFIHKYNQRFKEKHDFAPIAAKSE